MEGTVAEEIDRMVRRIVEGFDPEWIILYGSQARGVREAMRAILPKEAIDG